ncbi:MAG: hypothetical protein MUQ30_17095, partial [Anaerolineae bacterium]|nr:hypothetical protein [Anaerolineae bacterium]
MESRYHDDLTRAALSDRFSPDALEEIIAANLAQDALQNQLGTKAHFHFDNNKIAESLAYVEELHRQIAGLAAQGSHGSRQRVALGRLCHAVQDFYAHSNYVDLWLSQQPQPTPPADTMDGLIPELLNHPDLRTGTFVLLRDIIYYIPIIGALWRRIYVPPGSHEAMNLDSPERGWRFPYALVAALWRTQHEYER